MRNIVISLALLFLAPSAFAQGATAQSAAAADRSGHTPAHVLSRAEFDQLLAKPDNILLVDVRRPDEISKIGGLPVYLSVQLDDLERSLAWIPRGRSIITVSNHAKRAGTAAELLASKGFKVAGALGVEDYEKEGGTLTKVPIPTAPSAPASR